MKVQTNNCNTRRTAERHITPSGSARTVAGLTLALVAMVSISGCHIDMWRQPKIKPYWESDFFNDRQGSRPLVPGTVARGRIITDDIPYYTGKTPDGKLIRTLPLRAVQSFASPKDMLLRGQGRFNAYCSPCHGKAGNGNGFISQRGLGYWSKLPASFQTDRLRKVEDGHIYDTLVNGYGIMYGYGARVQDVNDRWAIVAYIRTLQLAATGATYTGVSAPAPETEVPGSSARNLDTPETTGNPAPSSNEPPIASGAGNVRSGTSIPATQNVPATDANSEALPSNRRNAPDEPPPTPPSASGAGQGSASKIPPAVKATPAAGGNR